MSVSIAPPAMLPYAILSYVGSASAEAAGGGGDGAGAASTAASAAGSSCMRIAGFCMRIAGARTACTRMVRGATSACDERATSIIRIRSARMIRSGVAL